VTRELVFCDRLLELCDDDEVAAICDHELAHLKESKAVLALRIVGSFAATPLVFIVPCAQHWGIWGLFPPLLTTLLLLVLVKKISRRMENKADHVAHKEQAGEGVYARALEKLYRENQTPAVAFNNRQVHPHLYDRMLSAGITPDYPRPQKPKKFTWIGWVFIVLWSIVFVAMIFLSGLVKLPPLQ